jgi:Ca2+-binding EF-hand superfamily protein
MSDKIMSPDGKFIWTGSEWIPAPPSALADSEKSPANILSMQDSVMSGDIVHNTVINNDTATVTSAVIEALHQLGMLNQQDPGSNRTSAPILEQIELPASFKLGDHVEYHSPTNHRWLDRCRVIGINSDGTYQIEVPYTDAVQIKPAVIIGTSPGTIRPASPPYKRGDEVLVNWKNYGTYYPGKIVSEYDDHTFMIHFDDGDIEDNVEWNRIEKPAKNSTEVQEYFERLSEAEYELIEAFKVFDKDSSGTISATEYFELLTEQGDNPLSVEDVVNEFQELGITGNSEINYRELAKYLVGSEKGTNIEQEKPEVIIRDAEVQHGRLCGYAYAHPKLGEGPIRSSSIIAINYDERATAHIETKNTLYVVGPAGWKEIPSNHPFNDVNNQLYTVQGAGTSKCNGTYLPATEFDGVLSYVNGNVLLLRWRMGNGDQWWYLADRNSLDRKRGDYYRVKSSSDTPPRTGWVSDNQTEGVRPYPIVGNAGN